MPKNYKILKINQIICINTMFHLFLHQFIIKLIDLFKMDETLNVLLFNKLFLHFIQGLLRLTNHGSVKEASILIF